MNAVPIPRLPERDVSAGIRERLTRVQFENALLAINSLLDDGTLTHRQKLHVRAAGQRLARAITAVGVGSTFDRLVQFVNRMTTR